MTIFRIIFFWNLLTIFPLLSDAIPKYKIVIDPGHGGSKQTPYEIYGDKFDTVSGRYLEKFKNGAAYNGNTEMEIVLEIAKEMKKILDLTQTRKGFKKFKNYKSIDSNASGLKVYFSGVCLVFSSGI